jgi:hypothetical protein
MCMHVQAVDKYGGANLPGGNGVGRGVVFLAWGSWAAKRVAGLDKVSKRVAVPTFFDISPTVC